MDAAAQFILQTPWLIALVKIVIIVGALLGIVSYTVLVERRVCAFIQDRVGVFNRGTIGVENLMWSSDYPHTAALWPRSQQFITETFGGLAEADRRKIVHDTAARLYRID